MSTVKCVCGTVMETTTPGTCYAAYGGVASCDLCGSGIQPDGEMHHCPDGDNDFHVGGFDFCFKCAEDYGNFDWDAFEKKYRYENAQSQGDYKSAEDDPELMQMDEDIIRYAHMHMTHWGSLRISEKGFHQIRERMFIMKHFDMDLFSKASKEENWEGFKEEMKLWITDDEFVQFMHGKLFTNEAMAKKLRVRIAAKIRALGTWFRIFCALGWTTVQPKLSLQLLRDYAPFLDFSYEFTRIKGYKGWEKFNLQSDSLTTYAVKEGNAQFTALLLDLNPVDASELDQLCDLAKASGQMHVYETLDKIRMGQSAYARVEQEVRKIDRTSAVVEEFMRAGEEKEDKKLFDAVVNRVKRAIKDRKPVSDEFMLIAWRHSVKEAGDPLKCEMWNVISQTLHNILQIPLCKVNWKWFEIYLMHSVIWFEQIDEKGRLLYEELLNLVATQWSKPKEYLKKHITKIEDTKEWQSVIDIPETNPKQSLRQTTVFDDKFRPIESEFDGEELKNMSLLSGRNIGQYYDMSGFLSNMVIRAFELDEVFHDTMREIFEINTFTNKNPTGKVMYTNGPVKTGDRCQAKAENEYSTAEYPTTANIVDVLRGSTVFTTVGGMVEGFNHLVEVIEKGNTAIKKIIRVKNTLKKNEEKRKKLGLYRYGDIKLNVMIAQNGKAIIGEIQLMTSFMLAAKKMDHELYSIVRRRPFIQNVQKSLELTPTKQQAFINAAIESKTVLMSQMFINFPEIDVFKLDDDGEGFGVIHRVCKNGNFKAFKIILKSFIKPEEIPKMVSLKSRSGDTPLMVVVQHCYTSGHYTILSMLLGKYLKHINVNHQNGKGTYAVQVACMNGRTTALKRLLDVDGINLNLSDKHYSCCLDTCVHVKQLECGRLLLEKYEKIHPGILTQGFLVACSKGYAPIIPYFLQCPNVAINRRVGSGYSAIHYAAEQGHTAVVKLLAQDKRINVTHVTNAGYPPMLTATAHGLLEVVKAIVKFRADEIDINVQSHEGRTPIIVASMNNHIECVKYFLTFPKIDLKIKDKTGKTCLDYAKDSGHDEIRELLLSKSWS